MHVNITVSSGWFLGTTPDGDPGGRLGLRGLVSRGHSATRLAYHNRPYRLTVPPCSAEMVDLGTVP